MIYIYEMFNFGASDSALLKCDSIIVIDVLLNWKSYAV